MTATFGPKPRKADTCSNSNLTLRVVVMIKKQNLSAQIPMTVAKPLKFASGIALALSTLILAGCAQVSSVQPGTPVAEVIKQYGTPDMICPSRDGGRRMVWSQQPEGETAYALHISKQGISGAPQQVLTERSFSILGNGEVWTRERVHCEFGPPANITRDDWGDDRQWVWSYRYMRGQGDAEIMYVYLGNDGARVTKYRSLPDEERNEDIASGITLYRW
jgi:hypothetical protein